ncbi:MAG: PASTA domain-containing protein [Croceibacterium sp.]
MSSCECDETVAGPEPKGTAYAQVLPMVAGAKAGDTMISAALLAQGRKQQAWLDRRGRLDEQTKQRIEARSTVDRARLRAHTAQLFAVASIPETDAEGMTIGGRVTKGGAGQEGLMVSALGRHGKAVDCTTTDARGMYRIVLKEEEEVLVQVTTAGGCKRLYLDDRPIPFERGGLAVRNIELAEEDDKPPCVDGPDTSNRLVMPDLVGKPVVEAERELKARKIEIAGRKNVVRLGFEERVVATDPEAGHLLQDTPRAVLTVGVRGEDPPVKKPEPGRSAEPVKSQAAAAPETQAKAEPAQPAPAKAKPAAARPAAAATPRKAATKAARKPRAKRAPRKN